MAKYIKKVKTIEVEAVQFNQGVQPYPAKVQANGLSPTGYSYGTLTNIGTAQNPNRDGFELIDKDWIVTEPHGAIYKKSDVEFKKDYEAV